MQPSPSPQDAGQTLRVLLWHWGKRGGGPRYTYELAKAFATRTDVETHLSLSKQSELFTASLELGLPGWHVTTYRNVPQAVLGSFTIPHLRRQFAQYLLSNRINVVLCTMPHVWNRFFLSIPRQNGATFVAVAHDATLHVGENSFLARQLLNREIPVADQLVVLSEYVQQQIVAHHPTTAARIHVVPHGVFEFGRAPSEYPRALAPDRPLRLLFFGRVLAYKGLDLLLDAYAELVRERPMELHIAGAGDLTSHQRKMAALPQVRLSNHWLSDTEIRSALASADILVAPYTEASQSGVIATAYGAGLPVVVTPVGGLREQVRQHESGIIATELSGASIAAAVRALAGNPDLYVRCARGAASLAENELAWPNVAESMVRILRHSLVHQACVKVRQ